MASPGASLSAALLAALALAASYAATETAFYVGGSEGWTAKRPPTDFQHWADSNRFLVNDKLIFKYNKSEDSVMQVTKPNYDACETRRYIRYMGSGDSVVVLSNPGPYYFISPVKGHCHKGQKMTVQVNIASPPPSASPSPAPSTIPHTPAPSPPPKSSSPAPSPPKPSPAPPTHQPPSSSPPAQPAPPTPMTMSPAPAPSPSSAPPAAWLLLSSSLTALLAVALFRN